MTTVSARCEKHVWIAARYGSAGPVIVEKHGRPVVVVLSVEEFERLDEGSNRDGRRRDGSSPSGPSWIVNVDDVKK